MAVLCPTDFTLVCPADFTLACPKDLTLAWARDRELPVKAADFDLCRLEGETSISEPATPPLLLSMLALEPVLSRWRSWAEMEGG